MEVPSDNFLHSSQLRGKLGIRRPKHWVDPLVSGLVPGKMLV